MLCDICKQNVAKIHLTEIVDGKTKKVDLCDSCSKEKGVEESSFALADLLLGLGASQELAPTTPAGAEVKCPSCGFSQADFKKSGRLGCADCYTTFADGLENLLKSMHKGTRHVGKVPRALRESRDCIENLKSLQQRLDKAVEAEDFEAAATLRDEIKNAREKLSSLPTH